MLVVSAEVIGVSLVVVMDFRSNTDRDGIQTLMLVQDLFMFSLQFHSKGYIPAMYCNKLYLTDRQNKLLWNDRKSSQDV